MASGPSSLASDQRVGQDQPALGVGVEHLDRLAVADLEDVADPGGVAARACCRSSGGRRPPSRRGASSGTADIAAMTAAAPPMSLFIVTMPSVVLMERPPESKVMPLPTSATDPRAPSGSYASSTNRGGCSDPRLTPSRPPSPSARMAFSSSTVARSPAADATSAARSASTGGVSDPPGSFTRSRASATASATRSPALDRLLQSLPAPPDDDDLGQLVAPVGRAERS